MDSSDKFPYERPRRPFFYGWYIVGVGILIQIASSFSLSSTLGIFLGPITLDLGVSRGAFSLVRTIEVLVSAAITPFLGPLIDRHGGRWLITGGALIASSGYLLLSQVDAFWQFFLVRASLVVAGDTMMNTLGVNVVISQWFIRKRGRAIAIANLGTGSAKAIMPLLATTLFVLVGWRQTWGIFGILTLLLVVGPAFAIIRKYPEDMGLFPDGEPISDPGELTMAQSSRLSASQLQALAADVPWTRTEAMRTQAFWMMVATFGVASIGIAGLNLHVFPFVTDLGHPPLVAATLTSTIALTQLASTLFWGFLAERVDVRKAAMAQFLIQALGLGIALTSRLGWIYVGFFFYGIGLGGSFVLREMVWANYFGRLSLGTVKGLGILLTQLLSALGAPFFGFLFDFTGSYYISFTLFAVALLASAILILFVQPPRKPGAPAAPAR